MGETSTEGLGTERTPRRDGMSRRTVVKGAAWSIPVIATAAAVPSAAASGPLRADLAAPGGCVAPGTALVDPAVTVTVSDTTGVVAGATVVLVFTSADGGSVVHGGQSYPGSSVVVQGTTDAAGKVQFTGFTAGTAGTVDVVAQVQTADGRAVTSNAGALTICQPAGNIWGWGRNASGEHAQGNGVSPTTTMVPWKADAATLFSGATSVAGAWGSFTALKSDGTLWSTGAGLEGQLGNGTPQTGSAANAVFPKQAVYYGSGAPVQGMARLVGSRGIDCTMFAQAADGTWWATGEHGGPEQVDLFALGTNDNGTTVSQYNSYVQVGQALPGGAGAVKEVNTANWWRYVYLMKDGTVYSAGRNTFNAAGIGPGKTDVYLTSYANSTEGYGVAKTADGAVFKADQMVADERNTFYIGQDGKLYGSGENLYGQLPGTGATTVPWVTPLMDLPNGATPVKIWAGPLRLFVKASDGNVYAAGRNAGGQLGVGDSADKSQWARVLVDEEIVDVQSSRNGADHAYPRTMFLTASGKVFYTGSTVEGGLSDGNGADTYLSTPAAVVLPAGKKAVSIAVDHEISQAAILVDA
ncbi:MULTISPECIES: hypothetical protein [Bacteria]|uniref:hypothetical protein n=1 Tax=Bacteria TaxID=2 RepID=UPI003C7ED585